jgi:hypothetical protein
MITIEYVHIVTRKNIFTETVNILPLLVKEMSILIDPEHYTIKSIAYYPGKNKYRVGIQ